MNLRHYIAVLQIATGMYYQGREVHETVHRRVLYSNGVRVRADTTQMPFGALGFGDGMGSVQPLVVETFDRLEKTHADGSESGHIATSGDELTADAADLVAFGLDVVVLPESSLAERVVAGQATDGGRRRAKLLQHVLDPARFVNDDELEALRVLCDNVLALRRPHYEAAMRAIRRVADAITFAASDITLSYTLFVAALESLSKDAVAPTIVWESYEKRKREAVDSAIEGLPPERVDRIRTAVLTIDQMSIRRKFLGFVLDHVTDDYYRAGAIGSARPIRAVDLPRAVDFAYRLRSKTLHELRELDPELREIPNQDDTLWHRGDIVLSLEGMHRLCQHVIRQYIERSPKGLDSDFETTYLDSIPGIIKVRLAPQLWIGSLDGFPATEGRAIFAGFVQILVDLLRGELDGVPDMAKPLARIEVLLRSESQPEARLPLIGVYVLWNGFVAEELRRTGAQRNCAA